MKAIRFYYAVTLGQTNDRFVTIYLKTNFLDKKP